jgi:hypothetical protein
MLQKKQNGTFANYFQIFLLVRNVFVCFKLLRNQNRTFVFSKNDIKTKPKLYKLRQGFPKIKHNFLLFQKKLETDQNKSFWTNFSSTDRKRFVSIQYFVSKTNIFDLFLEQKQQNESFRSWKNVGLTLLLGTVHSTVIIVNNIFPNRIIKFQ